MIDTSIKAPVFDLHCDAVLKLVHRNARFCDDNAVSHVDIPKMLKGNVNGVKSIEKNPAGHYVMRQQRIRLSAPCFQTDSVV